MSKFKKCETCKEHHFTDESCKDVYTVIHEDYTGEEGTKVRAWSHEQAAIKYAEKFNDEGDLIHQTCD